MENFIKRAVGKNESIFEILFLISYFVIQLILIVKIESLFASIVIVLFLLFLALERIFMRLGKDFKEEFLRQKLEIITSSYDKEMQKLRKEINNLEKENIKLKNKR